MDFSVEHLSRYLGVRLGLPVEVLEVERFGRGVSRMTWFVTCRRDSGEAERLVFRLDPPAGSVEPTPLDQEYFIYERLGRTDVPVAAALWWEDVGEWTGRPFYVRRAVEGSWNVPDFLTDDPGFDDWRIAISREHMRALARVHAVDWRGLGFDRYLPAPARPEDCGVNYANAALAQYEGVRGQAVPVVLEAIEWLRDNAPPAPCICLCKGTNGYGEEIFRNGKIVALSDWEEASIGDPAADFAFMQYFAPEIMRDGVNVWGMEKALAYYTSVSGIPVTVERVQYYGVIRALRLIIMAEKCAAALHTDPARADVRMAWTGTEVGHVCRQGVLAAMGLRAPPTAQMLADFHLSVESQVQ
ncbi:MAG: phosphotransferase family protein [Novosphingobium sp.]|nr:phosphotransferase family protein [Novosphingobium sp.]